MEPGPAVYLVHTRAEECEGGGDVGLGPGKLEGPLRIVFGDKSSPVDGQSENIHICLSQVLFWYTWKEACRTGCKKQQSNSGWQPGRRALIIPHHRKLKQTIKTLHPVHETTPCSDQKRLYVSASQCVCLHVHLLYKCVCKGKTGIKQFKVLQSSQDVCGFN